MKVSTDGVALGAWAKLNKLASTKSPFSILDICTGTGLLSLMLAQRYDAASISATITAIELDKNAAKQAQFNFEQSPWSGNNLSVVNTSIQQWSSENSNQSFDHIICNPPYFTDALKSSRQQSAKQGNDTQNQARVLARHNDVLPFQTLAQIVTKHMRRHGHFDLILPIDESQRFLTFANQEGLALVAIASLQHAPNKEPNRYLMRFARCGAIEEQASGEHMLSAEQVTSTKKLPENEQLTLAKHKAKIETIIVRDNDGQFHSSFAAYTKDFYLKL